MRNLIRILKSCKIAFLLFFATIVGTQCKSQAPTLSINRLTYAEDTLNSYIIDSVTVDIELNKLNAIQMIGFGFIGRDQNNIAISNTIGGYVVEANIEINKIVSCKIEALDDDWKSFMKDCENVTFVNNKIAISVKIFEFNYSKIEMITLIIFVEGKDAIVYKFPLEH